MSNTTTKKSSDIQRGLAVATKYLQPTVASLQRGKSPKSPYRPLNLREKLTDLQDAVHVLRSNQENDL
jgi:hypothetical protein